MPRSAKAHLLLIGATLVWGATFVIIKGALTDISPLLFNSVRMTIAAVLLLVIFRRQMAQLTRGALFAGSVVGVLLWLGYEFQTTGLKLTTASKSAFITGIAVVLVPLFMALGLRRRIKMWSAVGVGIVVIGLYLMTIPPNSGSGFDFASVNRGDLLTLACAVAFALEIIALGWATVRYSYQQITTVMIVVCAVLMFPTVPLVEHAQVVWSPTVLWAIGITATLATVVCFIVQAWAQQFTPPTHAALIFSLEPVFAWFTSWVFLHEELSMRAAAGAVMIIAGVLASELMGGAPRVDTPAEIAEMAD